MNIRKYVFVLIALSVSLSACDNNKTDNKQKNDSVLLADTCLSADVKLKAPSEKDSLLAFVQHMYDDIVPMFNRFDAGVEEYAYKKYASTYLQKLHNDVVAWNNKEETKVISWDCSPWILTNEYKHLEVKVLDAKEMSLTKRRVDIEIPDYDHPNDKRYTVRLSLILIKEDNQWKVDDFIGTESVDYAPTYAELLSEGLEEVNSPKKDN